MTSRTLKLGRVYGVPEFRIHHWKPEKRNTKIKAYLKVKTSCSDQVWDEIVKCALSTVPVVGIATIITGGTAALPAFLAVFLPCLAAKGIKLSANNIKIYTKFSRGRWHRVW
ncbi:MAG: hypothetical protein AB1861_29345 [Cyanobacteriota bacterium]